MRLDRNCNRADARGREADITMTKPDTVSETRPKLPMSEEQAYEADLRLLLHYF